MRGNVNIGNIEIYRIFKNLNDPSENHLYKLYMNISFRFMPTAKSFRRNGLAALTGSRFRVGFDW